MKRIVIVCLIMLLLAGCGQKEPAAPQVQMDQRAEAAPTAEPPAATEAPRVETVVVAPAAEAPTAEPTAEPALAEAESLVDRLVTVWESAGFLEGLFPYTAEDALDYYGIDELTEEAVQRIHQDYVTARREWIALIRQDAENEFTLGDIDPEVLEDFVSLLDREVDFENQKLYM